MNVQKLPARLVALFIGSVLLIAVAATTMAASPSPSLDPSASVGAGASATPSSSASLGPSLVPSPSATPFESFQGATAVATATPPSTDTGGGQADGGFPTTLLAAGLAATGLALIVFDARRRDQLRRTR